MFKKIFPILITVGGVVATAVSPALQSFWGAHSVAATTIVGAWGVVKYLLPSPLQQ